MRQCILQTFDKGPVEDFVVASYRNFIQNMMDQIHNYYNIQIVHMLIVEQLRIMLKIVQQNLVVEKLSVDIRKLMLLML